MAENSKIEWTDASWNPIRACNKATGKIGWYCEHASEGCRFCYAEAMNRRLGTGLDFKPGHRADVDLFLDNKMLAQPYHWKRPRMVFVCSMTDLFAEFVLDAWIDRIFTMMALCPQHSFQVLTKRSERMRHYMTATGKLARDGTAGERIREAHHWARFDNAPPWQGWPLPNVWLGISAERQQEADARIPDLLATPAAVRFVSLEPLLGPIGLTTEHLRDKCGGAYPFSMLKREDRTTRLDLLDWVIVGGESGREARACRTDWVRALIDQCRQANVACFVKQLGSNSREIGDRIGDTGFVACPSLDLRDRKGGDPFEWPEDMRVREFPKVASNVKEVA